MPSKKENFEKYPNEFFIETGSLIGDGIQGAIDAGFQRIISIELSDKYFDICKNRYQNDPRITLIKGDSYKVLPDVIKDINSRITFWLDGHHSCGDTALGDYWTPLMQELEVIKNHHIKDHIIMIDDMFCWENPNIVHGFYKDDIFKMLKEINNDYRFEYQDGCRENDILISYIK